MESFSKAWTPKNKVSSYKILWVTKQRKTAYHSQIQCASSTATKDRFCCMKALPKIAFQAPEIAISGGIITKQEERVTYFTYM